MSSVTSTTVIRSTQNDGKSFQVLRARCLREKKLFEDPEFPDVLSSIVSGEPPKVKGLDWSAVEWKRPGELVTQPQFFVDGASRFDINQGFLGDCWFLSAAAILSDHPDLFARVVPPGQGFTDKDRYAGIFHFHFWYDGEWVEVVIDDRLPIHKGNLLNAKPTENNEFWPPLIEKAFAKLYGACYSNISAGTTSESFTNFTGGIVEVVWIALLPRDTDIHNMMAFAEFKQSMMAASISGDGKPDLGLAGNHVYSVTKVINTWTPRLKLVRIRNPHGGQAAAKEWAGAWSDNSDEWKQLTKEQINLLQPVKKKDGEFWMSQDDFKKSFSTLEICSLGPETMSDVRTKHLEKVSYDGSWVRNSNAGGSRSNTDTFWTNPQYCISVEDSDDDDELATLVVSLIQKNWRVDHKRGAESLFVCYAVYELKYQHGGRLDKKFFEDNSPVEEQSNAMAIGQRSIDLPPDNEVIGRHRLRPGYYCIVPSTKNPGAEGDYLLRVFTEKKIQSTEMDDETYEKWWLSPKWTEDAAREKLLTEAFKKMAGEDDAIDAYELRDFLNATYAKDIPGGDFSADTCRSLVALGDMNHRARLQYEEFKQVCYRLQDWMNIFKSYDKNKNGYFNAIELRTCLQDNGMSVSNRVIKSLLSRYCRRDAKIFFDDFIHCVAHLRIMTAVYGYMSQGALTRQITLDEFIEMSTAVS